MCKYIIDNFEFSQENVFLFFSKVESVCAWHAGSSDLLFPSFWFDHPTAKSIELLKEKSSLFSFFSFTMDTTIGNVSHRGITEMSVAGAGTGSVVNQDALDSYNLRVATTAAASTATSSNVLPTVPIDALPDSLRPRSRGIPQSK